LKIVRDSQQFYKCQNSAEIVSHQVHLEFINNCHILEILELYLICICEHH